MTIIGQNGSGKTTLAHCILTQAIQTLYPVAILDTKGEILFNQYNPITKLKNIKKDTDVIVYRPDPDEMFDEDLMDEFLLRMYQRNRDSIVYIDELTSLGDSGRAKPGLLSLLSRGRMHLVNGKPVRTTTIGSTQAPFFVPRVVYRQSRSFAVFRLNDENDRKTVKRFTHPALINNPSHRHGFWFFKDTATAPRQVVLKINKKAA